MERENKKRKKKTKSVENKKTNSKESKHKDTKQKRENKVRRKTREKLRESLFFFEVIFFLNRKKEIKTKEPRYLSKKNVKRKKNSKMFLKIMHEKTNSKAKIDETQEKQQFFFNDKKSINDIFWNFCPTAKRQFIFREPKRRLMKENQEK